MFLIYGYAIGYISWGHTLALTLFSLSLFAVYFHATKRRSIFLFSMGYYLAAYRPMPIGTATYYDDKIVYGLLVWLGASLIASLVWSFIWSSHLKHRLWLFVIAEAVISLPPVGFVSGVNPIITAGLLFPSLGFYGLFLLTLLIYISTYTFTISKSFTIGILLFLFIFLSIKDYSIPSIDNIKTYNSKFDYGLADIDYFNDFQRQRVYVREINKLPDNKIVLAENALGVITSHTQEIWNQLDCSKDILAGGHIENKNGKWDNVLVELNCHDIKVLYKQRIPLPISMWKFWSNEGTNAYTNGTEYYINNDTKVGVLICYEQTLTYTYLTMYASGVDKIIGISNLWWARNTSLKKIQEQNMQLWSILFDTPMIYAWNE